MTFLPKEIVNSPSPDSRHSAKVSQYCFLSQVVLQCSTTPTPVSSILPWIVNSPSPDSRHCKSVTVLLSFSSGLAMFHHTYTSIIHFTMVLNLICPKKHSNINLVVKPLTSIIHLIHQLLTFYSKISNFIWGDIL